MDYEEKIQYLANIYHLVRADGRVSSVEEKVMAEVAKGIGVGYLETRKGLDRAIEKDFAFKYPARWSERVRNIEDMLLAAYADDKLHPPEKEVLLEYAKNLGINQKQFNIIKKETKERLAELRSKK